MKTTLTNTFELYCAIWMWTGTEAVIIYSDKEPGSGLGFNQPIPVYGINNNDVCLSMGDLLRDTDARPLALAMFRQRKAERLGKKAALPC
jgi:hypothetical protein